MTPTWAAVVLASLAGDGISRVSSPLPLVITATGDRVEVRWQRKGVPGTATATRAIVENGWLKLTGTKEQPVELRMPGKHPTRDGMVFKGERMWIELHPNSGRIEAVGGR